MSARRFLFIINLILSVSHASSQSGEPDILSLVAACNRTADTIPTGGDITAVLTFVHSTAETDSINVPATVFYFPGSDGEVHPEILNTISEAYGSHDYYTTGGWTRDEEIVYPAVISSPVSGIEFHLPRAARISSHFAYRPEFGRMHYGTDIAISAGDSIRVPMPGKVVRCGFDRGGYGRYLIVAHENGLETRYAHINSTLVSEGQKVETGEVIALSGNTGHSTGPHLHLEVRYHGIPVNPITVFIFKSPKSVYD